MRSGSGLILRATIGVVVALLAMGLLPGSGAGPAGGAGRDADPEGEPPAATNEAVAGEFSASDVDLWHVYAVSWGDGRIDVLPWGPDDVLWHRWYARAGGWSAWENLGEYPCAGHGLSSWAEGRLDVFAIGCDSHLRHKWYVRGQGWSQGPWEDLGAPSGLLLWHNPAGAVSWDAGRIDVFARASDKALWHRSYVRGQGWSGWENLGGALNYGPTVSSWARGRLDVFAPGEDNRLRHKWYVRGEGWSQGPWENLGAPPGGIAWAPAAVSWGDGRIDVFVRGADDALWHRWFVRGQGWSGWERLGGVLFSGPTVSSWSEGRLDVFAVGMDNRLRHKWYVQGRGWSPEGYWERLGAP